MRSSAALTVAVPGFCTTSDPATLARRAACSGSAPQAIPSVFAAITVSPAPVTSTAVADPCTGNAAAGAPGRRSSIPARPRVTRSELAASDRNSSLPASSMAARSPPRGRPASCSSSTSFGFA